MITTLKNKSEQFRQKNGREPTEEELAEIMDMEVEEIKRVMKTWSHPTSLETPVGEDEDGKFGDLLEARHQAPPTDSALHKMLSQEIDQVLRSLTYREREIIKLRFGLADGYSYTLEETGRIFKVTRERIRQIEAKAIKKLQHPSRSERLRPFAEALLPRVVEEGEQQPQQQEGAFRPPKETRPKAETSTETVQAS